MELIKGKKILVVAAHPDDEVLGCGATLAKAIDCGCEVHVLFVGEGISARFPFGQYDSQEFKDQTEVRQKGAEKALMTLGISSFKFGEKLCGQFDSYPLIQLVKEIEEEIKIISPDILLTHNPSEVNIDHRLTYEAVEVACRPTRDFIPNEIYTFEIPCSGSWTFETSFKPNVFINVEKYWEKKMAAWKCYVGEERPFPFPRSDEGLKTLSQYRGMSCNLKQSEAFKLVRKVVK